MLSQRTRAMLTDAEDLTDSLFTDLLAEIVYVPQPPEMPADLVDFNEAITTKRVRAEVMDLFVLELRAERDGVTLGSYMLGFESPPCASPDLLQEFESEWPESSEFPRGEEDPEYLVRFAETEIATASAKMTCQTRCGRQLVCLAIALAAGEGKQFIYGDPNSQPSGVRGGWGVGARKSINAGLVTLRRSYRNGHISDAGMALISQLLSR
jgi:hypothetical protein